MPTVTETISCPPCCSSEPSPGSIIYPLCCPLGKGIPARLYMTIFDDENKCPCINEKTFTLDYTEGIQIYGVPGGQYDGWIIRPPCPLPPPPGSPENPPPYQCYNCVVDTESCESGSSIISGGPYNQCQETAKTISRIEFYNFGFTDVYYRGPSLICYQGAPQQSGGFVDRGFYFLFKFYHEFLPFADSCYGNFCNQEDDHSSSLNAQFPPIPYFDAEDVCDSPFYREFTVENLYNMQTGRGSYPFLNGYLNIFNCSGVGNLRVVISE